MLLVVIVLEMVVLLRLHVVSMLHVLLMLQGLCLGRWLFEIRSQWCGRGEGGRIRTDIAVIPF